MTDADRIAGSSVAQAIRAATRALSDAGPETGDNARMDAELLMAHALGVTRSDLLIRHLWDDVPGNFDGLVDRRLACEPVAYITGTAGFYGREFMVSPDVLIPRPDSEVLIDTALEIKPDARRILDLGTGSGALLLTALAEMTEAVGVGIDASPGAVSVARSNADRLALAARATIDPGDWRRSGWFAHLGQFDLILCNPPYVKTDAPLDRMVRDFEPATALFAGTDGLDDYRILLPALEHLMAKGGCAIFEIGFDQGDDVRALVEGIGMQCEIRRDLANRQRCVAVR